MGNGCSATRNHEASISTDTSEYEEEEELVTTPNIGVVPNARPSITPSAPSTSNTGAAHVRQGQIAYHAAVSPAEESNKPPPTVASPMIAAACPPIAKPPKRTPVPPSESPTSQHAPRKGHGYDVDEYAAPTETHHTQPPPTPAGDVCASSPLRKHSSGRLSGKVMPAAAAGSGGGGASVAADPWSEDLTTELPRAWQNKALRALTLIHTSQRAAVVQPPVLFGALGDMRGERIPRTQPLFNLRAFIEAAPVVLSFRLAYAVTQHTEALQAKGTEAAAKATATARLSVGFGSKLKPSAIAMLFTGPPLLQPSGQREKRMHAQKPALQRVGMYAATVWMPSTLRKGNRRRQRAQFPYQRELLSVLTHGHDAGACFVAHILPDVLVNLQSFDINVRQTLGAAVRATLHKLYDVMVTRHLQQEAVVALDHSGSHFGSSDATVGVLRAPRVDVSMVYLREDNLFAATTVGASEGQLFFLTDVKGMQVVPLESDAHSESDRSQDERSISSIGSSISSGSRNSSSARRAKKDEQRRVYDMPVITTYYCPLSEVIVEPPTTTVQESVAQRNGSCAQSDSVRMATFSSSDVQSNLGAFSPCNTGPGKQARFAIVLATDSFWTTLSKQAVWELLHILHALNCEANTQRHVDTPPLEMIQQLAPALPESTQQRLLDFYHNRVAAFHTDLPSMPEAAMAEVLSGVAEGMATIENSDNAARMSVTVLSIY